MNCPNGCGKLRDRGDEQFPDCEECGFEFLDESTIALRDEVRREFEQAKREYWPDPVPSYADYHGEVQMFRRYR